MWAGSMKDCGIHVNPAGGDDEIGWYAGGGGDIALNEHLSIFAEYLFRDVEATAEDDDLESIEDSADIDLSGSVVNVGLMLR